MSNYPATSLAKNKGKYYVLLTIPQELRKFFKDRKQLKKSTGTSDLADAKRRQHEISAELYVKLNDCKPDPRVVISKFLNWIGDAEEVQRMEDNGDLEGMIMYHKYMEYTEDSENDWVIDVVNEGGSKALEVYREWKAEGSRKLSASSEVCFSVCVEKYLETKPYGPAKTMRDCELSLSQFQAFGGDVALSAISPVLIHEYASHVGETKSRETVAKKIGYVKRMFDHAVRKGWAQSNVFSSVKLDKKVGKKRISYTPLSQEELNQLFALNMPEHVRSLFSILVSTGMRLDEAALLNWEDVKEDQHQDVVFFDLTNSLVKNQSSQRKVPVHSTLSWIMPEKRARCSPSFLGTGTVKRRLQRPKHSCH